MNSGAFHGEPFLASHELRPSARNIEIDVWFVLQPVYGAFTTGIFHDVIAFQCGRKSTFVRDFKSRRLLPASLVSS